MVNMLAEMIGVSADEKKREYTAQMDDGYSYSFGFDDVFNFCQRHHPQGIVKPNGPCWDCIGEYARREYLVKYIVSQMAESITWGDE